MDKRYQLLRKVLENNGITLEQASEIYSVKQSAHTALQKLEEEDILIKKDHPKPSQKQYFWTLQNEKQK